MARNRNDPERVTDIVVYAEAFGPERTAKQFGVSQRTVFNYRGLVKASPVLAAACTEKRKHAKERMGEEFIAFLRRGVKKLDELCAEAGPERIRDVAGAVKIVGDLFTVREVFGGQQPQPDREGPATPEAPGDASDRGSAPVHKREGEVARGVHTEH